MADFTHSFTVPPTVFAIPEPVRAFVENGVAQAQQNYDRLKDVAKGNNVAVEAVLDVTSKGISDYSAKMLGFFQVNTFAVFDLAQQLANVKSFPQAAELWQSHARKQMETLTDQSRELVELSRKVATDAVEPFKDSVAKLFQPAV
jgi:phasin